MKNNKYIILVSSNWWQKFVSCSRNLEILLIFAYGEIWKLSLILFLSFYVDVFSVTVGHSRVMSQGVCVTSFFFYTTCITVSMWDEVHQKPSRNSSGKHSGNLYIIYDKITRLLAMNDVYSNSTVPPHP